ncbi:MAG: FprA family A-type flavoprotein [Caldisericia bacterium]|jgi:flavorubredoxin|nr:FprA family A-type flavoprotein [Caldisericia bacterium]
MSIREVIKDIYFVGSIDWDRRLFDELIPLPDGTSYNSYLIKTNDKIVLIDSVDPTKKIELINNLKELNIDKLDYIISQHAEQDHSGAIPDILEIYNDAKVITNEKGKELLMTHLHISENKFHVINDGEVLKIGNKTFKFIFTPWVHWPETFVTYLVEDKILFTCDFFGSHIATSSIFVDDPSKAEESAKRYYAEIMMPFRNIIVKNLEKIKNLDIKIIAPSHGYVYDRPEFIVNLYKEWVSDSVKNKITILFVSMHGSTKNIVDFITKKFVESGIEVKRFNLTNSDIGEIAMSLVDSASVIFATPTVLTGPHPLAFYASYIMSALKPKTKFIGIVGSFGWGGQTVNIIKETLKNLKAEYLGDVLIKGDPNIEDYEKLNNFVNSFLNKHKELNLL